MERVGGCKRREGSCRRCMNEGCMRVEGPEQKTKTCRSGTVVSNKDHLSGGQKFSVAEWRAVVFGGFCFVKALRDRVCVCFTDLGQRGGMCVPGPPETKSRHPFARRAID